MSDVKKLVIVYAGLRHRIMWRYSVAAITWPWRTIWVLGEFDGNQPLYVHELTHIAQIKRDGAWRFAVSYIWQLMRYGYWNISYEIEAYAASGPISLLPSPFPPPPEEKPS